MQLSTEHQALQSLSVGGDDEVITTTDRDFTLLKTVMCRRHIIVTRCGKVVSLFCCVCRRQTQQEQRDEEVVCRVGGVSKTHQQHDARCGVGLQVVVCCVEEEW